MLISPPFLPAERAGESDVDWVARAMPTPVDCAAGTYAPEGSFPVSSYMQWHNGVHCTAPHEDGHHLPVRAVADGTVVFVAPPVPANADLAHPLNYLSRDRPAWTDNGCVVVRHTTDIGAAGGVPTRITFFSLSMHLRTIADGPRDAGGKRVPWKIGDRIWRKDVLGEPGQIMGVAGRLHFEICCDEANLKNMIGRPVRWEEDETFVTPKADGRTDAVFGSVFIYLPGRTPTCAIEPADPVRKAAGGQPLGVEQWVEIRYDNGTSYIASRDVSGKPVGATPFDPLKVVDFEYDMYKQALDRHAAYLNKGGTLPSSPSGWYELLRFGRNLGPDPLPADAAHWRRIPTSKGNVWADLNAEGTFKFSEADFLPVMGWNCFGDDTNPEDQRCDSVELKRLIRDRDPGNGTRMTREALCKRIAENSVREKLRRSICRFPTEWDRATVAKRYSWTRDPKEDFGMDDQRNWDRFMRHCDATTFSELPDQLKNADWRFHPVEFIGVMRRCGWMSADELTLCLPRKSFEDRNLSWAKANLRAKTHAPHINCMIRKYLGDSGKRKIHLLTQIYQETGLFRNSVEIGAGNNKSYSAFYGRGYIQITWPGNYRKYGFFRGFADQAKPIYVDLRITTSSQHLDSDNSLAKWAPKYDPDIVGRNLAHAAEASGMYWVSKSFRGTRNINRVCDLIFDAVAVAFNCWLTNGGVNGYKNRQQFANYLANIILDRSPQYGEIAFSYPPLQPSAKPQLCQTFPPTKVPLTLSETTSHEKQIS